jgi:drug/metabolite transporter (DMT)-like permease
VNVAALGEPVGATIIAWLVPAIGEQPPASAIAGGIIVLAGIVLAMTDRPPGAGAGVRSDAR